jgi:uncharacterized protein (TIGR03437 family)
MFMHRRSLITVALCAVAFGRAWAEAPQFTTLEIEWENYVAYANNLADPSKLATSANMVNANIRSFMTAVLIADIVSVNGKPARGSWVFRNQFILLFPSPMPGQAIGDIGRGVLGDYHLEILQTDGTPVGSIMSSGFATGPAPPGAPPGLLLNLAVTGGTGAFLGARGFMTSPPFTVRVASMEEDPANRRIHGGGRGRFIVYLIPLTRPEIVSTASGPAVFHADFSPVSTTRPARAGETLIVTATGLGPTRPGLIPGTPFPESPLQEVNSPVEVTLNGRPAEAVSKIGWPGTTDTYRVDIRVPEGTDPGMATLQVTAAFVQGREVRIPVQ